MKKTKQKPNHTLEPMEPRLLFSAGLEGVLAADALTTTTASLSPELIQQLSTEAPVTSDVQSDADISHELVFIDTDTPDYEQLVEDLLADQDESRRVGVVLLYTAGLRRGELLRPTVGDYDRRDRTLLIRISKFHKSRLLPLSADAVTELEAYLSVRRASRSSRAGDGVRLSGGEHRLSERTARDSDGR